ncbi:hypothetical protein BVX97_00925 [bacterium E08(2017)]|nr:hypothetical protein BVX97_00925 [bacterium E08(2017)]
MEKALQLVDLAESAGADAVKFQVFNTDKLISMEAPDWKDRFREKELSYEQFAEINDYCASKGITFLATAHDYESLEFLQELDLPAYKIGSGEIGNWSFIRKVLSLGKPVIFSTGMYSIEDIDQAMKVAEECANPDVVAMSCTTMYPCPPEMVKLQAINVIRERYGIVSGYSDHTSGFHFPVCAVALGAAVIEKHITLDYDVPNAQDWKVSCGAHDLPLMVSQIREIEKGLAAGGVEPSKDELGNLKWARKSIVASRDIDAGALVEDGDVTTKRPGTGLQPYELKNVIGRTAKVAIKSDTLIKMEDLI